MPSTFLYSRRTRRAPWAALLAATFALGCARDPAYASIAAEVEKGVNAVRTKNIDAYMEQIDNAALSADSITAANAREAIRTNVLAEWGRTTTRSIDVDIESVASAQDSAIVATSLYWDRIVVGPVGADTVVSNIKHRELWRLTPKGWRPFKVLYTGGTNTTNGKKETVNKGG